MYNIRFLWKQKYSCKTQIPQYKFAQYKTHNVAPT